MASTRPAPPHSSTTLVTAPTLTPLPSEPLTRRVFVHQIGWTAAGLAAVVAGVGGPSRADGTQNHESPSLDASLLDQSLFAYISPIKAGGSESSCHAELWYAWLDGSVVVTVASDGWKASALERGLDRARIWVGDHGRWKTWYGGRNEEFRKAPHFDARAEKISDSRLLERLLGAYERKYPDEIASWRDVMRTGNADGTRVVIRYTPVRS